MKQDTGAYRDLARRLLEYEAGPAERPAGPGAAQRTCEKLGQGLAMLVGPAGFQALLQRALHLTGAEYPLLRGVQGFDGACLAGLAERTEGQDPAQVNAALVAVFGSFFWLLGTFIGDDLTQRQVRRIYPQVPLSEAGSRTEEAVP